MSKRTVLRAAMLGLIAMLGLTMMGRAPASPAPTDPQTASDLAKARVEVIAQIFGLNEQKRQGGLPTLDSEHVYAWSRRWLDAQREASDKKTDHIAALEAHLQRMQALEKQDQERYTAGVGTWTAPMAGKFYRLEAESWLAQAKAK